LPDGRTVCIGGEHEDYYDPDFCIYNDVVVFGPNGSVEIYGYPEEIFPPTDFHTATLDANRIIVVGCLGYKEARRPGHTPVYALDQASYAIEIPTTGQMPGWISKHEASTETPGLITVRGGKTIHYRDGKEIYRRNIEDYQLNLRTQQWTRLTSRNWLQFSITQEGGGPFSYEQRPKPTSLIPGNAVPLPCDLSNSARFKVESVSVLVTVGVWSVDIMVEGSLSEDSISPVTEHVRRTAETSVRRPCVLEKI